MFSHTVLLKFSCADGEFFDKLTDYAERMRAACDGVIQMEFVKNESVRSAGFTHGFVTSFVDEAAHDRYQTVPAHVELKQFMMPHVTELLVLDATIS